MTQSNAAKTVCRAPAVVLLAGAVLSAPAFAFDLSVYGVGHLSADSIDTGSSSSSYFHSNSSRLGFKGGHDIGNGLTVLYQYESGVDLTGHGDGDGNGGIPNNNGQIFTKARDSFIGLKGGFGTALIGRLPAVNQWLYDYNLFGDQVGDLGNIWGVNLPGRVNHAAHYRTPDFAGFSLGLSYVPNQGVSNTSAAIAKADYGIGGFKIGGAYANIGTGSGNPNQKASAITGSYSAGIFSVGAGAQKETAIGGVSGADRTEYQVGGSVKVGSSGTIKLQYARAGDLSGTSDTGARQTAVGYDHAIDGATTVYVAYARTSNDSAASYVAYDWGHGDQGVPAMVAGNSPKALSIGFVYKFDANLVGKK
jgi:predicted porin